MQECKPWVTELRQLRPRIADCRHPHDQLRPATVIGVQPHPLLDCDVPRGFESVLPHLGRCGSVPSARLAALRAALDPFAKRCNTLKNSPSLRGQERGQGMVEPCRVVRRGRITPMDPAVSSSSSSWRRSDGTTVCVRAARTFGTPHQSAHAPRPLRF